MSYLSQFERSFSDHTLKLVQSCRGPFEATILVNSLIGLIVLPTETALRDSIPESPIAELPKWGINRESVLSIGKPDKKNNPRPDTVRGFVINLRHCVAHFKIRPVPPTDEVHAFEFKLASG